MCPLYSHHHHGCNLGHRTLDLHNGISSLIVLFPVTSQCCQVNFPYVNLAGSECIALKPNQPSQNDFSFSHWLQNNVKLPTKASKAPMTWPKPWCRHYSLLLTVLHLSATWNLTLLTEEALFLPPFSFVYAIHSSLQGPLSIFSYQESITIFNAKLHSSKNLPNLPSQDLKSYPLPSYSKTRLLCLWSPFDMYLWR